MSYSMPADDQTVFVQRIDESYLIAKRELQTVLGAVVVAGAEFEGAIRGLYSQLLESPHAALVANGQPLKTMWQGIDSLLKTVRWRTALSPELHAVATDVLKRVRPEGDMVRARNAIVHGQWTVASAARGIHISFTSGYWKSEQVAGVWTLQTIFDVATQLELAANEFVAITNQIQVELHPELG